MTNKPVVRFFLSVLLLCLITVAWGYFGAIRDPVVRQMTVELGDWPAGGPPLRLVLVSDIHVIGPDMPPQRLERIVGQINALKPDLVLLAGDYVSDRRISTRHYPAAVLTVPLSKLRPRLGVYAVLGNHDHWRNPAKVRKALHAAGVTVLDNDAARAGPIVVGGVGDSYTSHADLPRTLARMRSLGGAHLLLSHSPDPFATLPSGTGLMLAGHTHCGQISPPVIGPLMTASDFGRRYVCGVVRERRNILIVTAGLGSSMFPARIGAVPDVWLITLKGRTANERDAASSQRKTRR